MSIGDERPRILDDDHAAILEEYSVDKAIGAACERWHETGSLQRVGSAIPHQFLALPIIAKLRARFEADYAVAQTGLDKTKPHTVDALHCARERLQLISGEHAPLDEEIHAEHDALAPVLESIDSAITAIEAHETELGQLGRLPWYRRRVGGHGYRRRLIGPVRPEESRFTSVAGHEDTEMATRADQIWFDRAGADPIVALKIAQSVMNAVRPPSVNKRRGQLEDEQINHVLWLICDQALALDASDAQALLIALEYPAAKVRIKPLHTRLHRLRKEKRLQQAVAAQPSRPRKP